MSSQIEVAYPGNFEGEGFPKRISPNAVHLCSAAWSWSPAHSRIDEYWLHSGSGNWFLWIVFRDPGERRVERFIVARGPKTGQSDELAALELLGAFWKFDRDETELDRPHEYSAHALPMLKLEEIMSSVWPRER